MVKQLNVLVSLRRCRVAGTLLLCTLAHVAGAAPQQRQNGQLEKPAEQVYENIQVFKGLPQSQLLNAMFFMSASLDVSCGHCHVNGEFEKDDKTNKQTARKMILMVRQLNESQFQGKLTISCNTCHRRQTPPAAPLAFATIEVGRPEGPASQTGMGELPTVEQLFARHLQAVGGEAALKKITSRVMKGTRSSSEGWSSPVEIDQKAPDKWISSFRLQAQFVSAFDGSHGWNQDNQGVHDANPKALAQLKQDAEFYRDAKLKEMFPNARTVGKDKINGADAYVVEAKTSEGAEKKIYFDVGTGLLIRILGFDPSPFGPIPNAVDYADYREVDGIKVPFTISHLKPDFSMMDKFVQIDQNVSMAVNRFDKPTPAKDP